jgi:type I restriction enzyme S subunit
MWNPAAQPEGTFRYVDLSALDQATKEISASTTVLCSEAPSRARQLLKTGDVLVSTVRPNLNGVAAVTEAFDGATASTGFCILRSRPEKLCSRYLAHWVRSPQFVEAMVRQATGASYPAITDRIVKSSLIPLPPPDEQRRIAAILDKSDALRRKRKRALELLNGLSESIFLERFGDPIENPKGWTKITVGQALEQGYIKDIQDGYHGERHPKVTDFVEDGVPFITANCLRSGSLNISDTYKLEERWLAKLRVGFGRPGDLLLTHKGTIGEVAIVPPAVDRVILSPQVTYYRMGPELNARFLMSVFRTRSYQSILANAAEQSTRAYIGLIKQRELAILLPPVTVQSDFALACSKIDRLVSQFQTALVSQDNFFSSLQHRAFSGQLQLASTAS